MKKIKTIGYSTFMLLLLGCGNAADENVQTAENNFTINNQLNLNTLHNSNEFVFKGGVIHLEEEGNQDQMYTIQEITKQNSDIKYRAKRIPTELYLKNKGLNDLELAEALAEVEGEQLFYFEFEEQLKQDLIKKYLEENLDANIAYLSFDIFNDFKLVTAKGDTISSSYSIYEQSFHLAPYERLIVSFAGVDRNEEVKLLYNDQLFGKGKFDFAFASTTYLENNIKNPS